jgi:phage repressor protein C with HTH and peptisase S24 domain
MRHEDVWRALDTLAAENGLSPSGLARAAGLDPTAFNRSKRATPHGRLRWPSTESLSRVLAATGASLENFTALVGGARALASLRPPGRGLERAGTARRLPQVAFSALLQGGDVAESGEETALPLQAEPGSYAIRLDTAAFEPVLREGGLLIASPETPVQAGDRVVLHRHPDMVLAGIVGAIRPDGIDIDGFGCTGIVALHADSVRWMHRISWAAL